MHHVERLALRESLNDVDEHDIGRVVHEQEERSGRANVAGAHDGHFGIRQCTPLSGGDRTDPCAARTTPDQPRGPAWDHATTTRILPPAREGSGGEQLTSQAIAESRALREVRRVVDLHALATMNRQTLREDRRKVRNG